MVSSFSYTNSWLLVGPSTRDSGHARRVRIPGGDDNALVSGITAAPWNSSGRWILRLRYVYSTSYLQSLACQCNVKRVSTAPRTFRWTDLDHRSGRVADSALRMSYLQPHGKSVWQTTTYSRAVLERETFSLVHSHLPVCRWCTIDATGFSARCQDYSGSCLQSV